MRYVFLSVYSAGQHLAVMICVTLLSACQLQIIQPPPGTDSDGSLVQAVPALSIASREIASGAPLGALIVEIRDAEGNLITSGPDASAVISLSLSSGTGTLSGTTSIQAVGGIADFSSAGISISLPGDKVILARKSDTSAQGGSPASSISSVSIRIVPLACDSGSWGSVCTISSVKDVPAGAALGGIGDLVIESGGMLRNQNPQELFSIQMGGSVTVKTGGEIRGNLSQLQAASLTVETNGRINADALGYLGGLSGSNASNDGQGAGGGLYGTGGGAAGGGGGYGGSGQPASIAAATGGTSYGDPTNPVDFGSGGGSAGDPSSSGGNGGGLLNLRISGVLSNSGEISARGGAGACGTNWCAGGGSGGSINVQAGSLGGTGVFSVEGGAATWVWSSGGQGAPGRIHISSDRLFAGDVRYVSSRSGAGSYQAQLPGPDALCDSGTWASTCVVSSLKVLPQNYHVLSGNSLTLAAGGVIRLPGVDEWLSLALSGDLVISGSGAQISGNIKSLQANSVTLGSSGGEAGSIIGNIGSPDAVNFPGIHSTTNVTVHASGLIDASGKGALGGRQKSNHSSHGLGTGPGLNEGISGSVYYGGGGYGGNGGRGGSAGALGGTAYGSSTNPLDYGSGGAAGWSNNPGGNGGGIIHIQVSGACRIEGRLLAEGAAGYASGGGSGGSIHITAGTIDGAGRISANGGRAQYGGGGGGGGRILISADTLYPGNVAYEGGAGREGEGGVGQAVRGSYHAVIPGPDAICDSGDWASTCVLTRQKALSQNHQSLSGNHLDIQAGGGLRISSRYEWLNLTLSGNLSVAGAGASIQANIQSLQANQITIGTAAADSGKIVGNVGAPDSTNYPGIHSTVDLTVNSGGSILADSAGSLGGYQGANYNVTTGRGLGPGVQSTGHPNYKVGSGGGHGGIGGDGSISGAVGGTSYGVASAPLEYGSGGGAGASSAPGGNGGGLVHITLSGSLVMDGLISVNGGNGGSGGWYQGGGGSGGSIYLDVVNAAGAGTLNAKGGRGFYDFGNASGGGSGGRVALVSSGVNTFSGSLDVSGGLAGGAGATAGQTGSTYP